MIRAETFLDELQRAGFGLLAGVPCSYLTALIDSAIGSTRPLYVGATNEGDAIAMACGAQLGGVRGAAMFQNSGLGNAVNPLTSLTATFRIPILLLTTWRGEPDGPGDEPQHAMMGEITPRLLELMGIPWELLPESDEQIGPALARAVSHMQSEGTPYALIARKGAFTGGPQTSGSAGNGRPPLAATCAGRQEEALEADAALRAVQSAVGATDAVLATTGYTGRALYALEDRRNQFYMVGSMGCVSSLGLGLAKVRPERRFVVLDGDGAMLMRMGAVATLGHERPPNLVHVMLDNGVHDSTGSQSTVSDSADLAEVARACGYPRVVRATTVDELADAIATSRGELAFVHVRTRPRSDRSLPRPSLTAPEMAARFRAWLADG